MMKSSAIPTIQQFAENANLWLVKSSLKRVVSQNISNIVSVTERSSFFDFLVFLSVNKWADDTPRPPRFGMHAPARGAVHRSGGHSHARSWRLFFYILILFSKRLLSSRGPRLVFVDQLAFTVVVCWQLRLETVWVAAKNVRVEIVRSKVNYLWIASLWKSC